MSQYATLDDMILGRLALGGATFATLFCNEIREECERIEREAGGDAFRYLDRRLQALRKAGKITYNTSHGWTTRSQT